jgi:hypothetical protein
LTGNQSLRDRAAKDTIGLHPLPQLAGESVMRPAFLPPPAKLVTPAGRAEAELRRGRPFFDLAGRNAGLELKRNARGFIHTEFDDLEEAIGFVVRESVKKARTLWTK